MGSKGRVAVVANEFGAHRTAVVANKHPGLEEIFRNTRWADAEPRVGVTVPEALAVIKARLRASGQVLKRIPSPRELGGLRGGNGSWPNIVHTIQDWGAYTAKAQRPARPTARELDDLDEVLGWLLRLDEENRTVAHACMVTSLRKAAAADPRGRSHVAMDKAFDRACAAILEHLLRDAAG